MAIFDPVDREIDPATAAMSYLHHYPFSSHPAIPIQQAVACDPPFAYPSISNPMENYLYPHHHPLDFLEYYRRLPIMEDYDDHAENASRPRLTKEQVDTLEAQFQAHPKPNSNVKRQLAAQTNLSLPRVAVGGSIVLNSSVPY
jgi:Homeodomain